MPHPARVQAATSAAYSIRLMDSSSRVETPSCGRRPPPVCHDPSQACIDLHRPHPLRSRLMQISVLNGVNLNMLGRRDPEQYGSLTLSQLETQIYSWASDLTLNARCFSTN